jgi:hypothetical protein
VPRRRHRTARLQHRTPASTLAQLKLLNPADAIRVLRAYTEQELSESYGMTTILKGLDEVEADYFPEALTATDYLFWKQKIADGVRFSPKHGGVKSVPRGMVERLAKKAEAAGLTLEERQTLLKLLDEIE